MDLGGLLRALGYGTVAGLGTAEEQRTRNDRLAERAAAERRHQESLGLQRENAAESRRLHDLEWGMASPGEMGFYRKLLEGAGVTLPDDGGSIRRRDLPGLMTTASSLSAREPYVPMDPVTLQPVGGTSRLPISPEIPGTGLPAESILLPPENPATSENPVPTVLAPPTPNRRAVPVKAGQVDDWAGKRRTFQRDEAKGKAEEEKQRQIEEARGELEGGATWEQIRGRYPKITAKDAIGYEPAAPMKPDKPNIHVGGKGEVIEVTPDKKVVTLRPPREDDKNPDKTRKGKADADLAELRLKREKAKDAAIQSADELDTLMRAGKPLPLIASRIVRDLRSESAALMKAAQEYDLTESEKAEYAADAKDLMARATAIATYRPGKPGGASTLPKLSDIVPGVTLGTKAQSVAEKITQGR